MNQKFPAPNPSPFDGIRWLDVSNVSGEPIPAFALLRVVGAAADGTPTVGKPNADSQPYLMVNGPTEIATGGNGIATYDEPATVAYDDADTPAPGDEWGSASGSWWLTSGKTGWVVRCAPGGYGTVEAVRAGASALNTQNVDGTEVEPATTDLRADQATGVKISTETGYQRLYLDLDQISDDLTFSKSLTVVTGVCIELTLNKTNAATTVGGETVLHDVTASLNATVTTKTVSLLSGTTVGTEKCAAIPTSGCCTPPPPPVTFTGCAHEYPGEIFATLSGATGTCGCFAGSVSLLWDAGTHQYLGTFTGCTGTVTFYLLINSTSSPTDWTASVAGGSYTFSSGTASQVVSFSCGDLPTGLTVDVDFGSCVGSFSLDFSE